MSYALVLIALLYLLSWAWLRYAEDVLAPIYAVDHIDQIQEGFTDAP